MSSSLDFTHNEEGYAGVTYKDFEENFSHIFKGNEHSDSCTTFKQLDRIANLIRLSLKTLINHRRLFWGYFLRAYADDTLTGLVNTVKARRKNYWRLVDYHNESNTMAKIQTLDPQIFHPLAPIETNPWAMSQRSKELLDEIWQDVERTYQERSLFQNETVRKSLQRVLYTWSMDHKYISYKQGMNELLAIIYIVCYRDQVMKTQDIPEGENYFEVLCSSSYEDIEADSYTLFNSLLTTEFQLMFDVSILNLSKVENKEMEDTLAKIKSKRTKETDYNPLIARCNYIYHDLLKSNDLVLYAHLKNVELEPHLFLIRWIRLLFSREFNVNETLNLWDILFADHFLNISSDRDEFQLQFIDYFAVAMLIFVRENLLENDINYCLQRLFKYPPVEDISHLALRALNIRNRTIPNPLPDSEAVWDKPSPEITPMSDDTPKSIIIQVLDDYTAREGNQFHDCVDEEQKSSDLKMNLIQIATKIYNVYEVASKSSGTNVLTLLKDVHGDVTKLISTLDESS